MVVALGIAAGLIALLLALLAVPIEVAFRFEGRNAVAGEVDLLALLGLLHVRTRIPADPSPARRPKRRSRGGKPRASAAAARRLNVFAVLRRPDFRRRVLCLLRDLVRAVHVRHLEVHLRLGLGDPADTGRLWGLIAPLAWWVPRPPHAQVSIEPDFDDAVLAIRADGRLILIPLQFVALAVGFALSPASVRAWHMLRRSRAHA